MFLCRERELQKLDKLYERNEFECVVIYGRRRVGKTSLINEFCKNKKNIYFSALDTTAQENLKTLSKAIHSYRGTGIGHAPLFSSYDDAFVEITALSRQEHIVFVIDEYPYLAKADPSMSSRLQHLIDHVWGSQNMYLILCGSSMSFMEYQVLGYESPLYGRRTAQFKIEPLTYRETAVFNPVLTAAQNAIIYGITGGIPHYINKLRVRDNLDEAILENLLDPTGYLFEEPTNLLKQELREPAVYNSIITAIAEGASRLNEISTKTGVETGSCTKYLKVLADLGIVKKETPITEKIGKKSVYLLDDNLFRFWYRFVPPNITAISSGKIRDYYDNAVKKKLPDYMGLVFEKMCRDYLVHYCDTLPMQLASVGQWWGTDAEKKQQVQIDIVGTPADGTEYIIGSCKFRSGKIGIDELQLLKKYARVFGRGSKYHYYIFSKGGFTESLLQLGHDGEVVLLGLEDIFSGAVCIT